MTRPALPTDSRGRGPHSNPVKAARPATASAAPGARLDWFATLRHKGQAALAAEHLRYRPAAANTQGLHCIVIDCSSSMLQAGVLAIAKRLLLELCARSYRERSLLSVISFAGDRAELVLPPAKAVSFNEHWISALGGGGGSPLAAGLALAETTLRRARRQHGSQHHQLWLISDFRLRELPSKAPAAELITLINCEHQRLPLHRAATLAEQWQAEVIDIAELWPLPS